MRRLFGQKENVDDDVQKANGLSLTDAAPLFLNSKVQFSHKHNHLASDYPVVSYPWTLPQNLRPQRITRWKIGRWRRNN
jgi:hypothetical protein